MKHSLRVKITIIFSSTQLNLSLHYDIFVNTASTYTYYRPSYYFINPRLLKQVIFCDKNIYKAVGLGISAHDFAYLM